MKYKLYRELNLEGKHSPMSFCFYAITFVSADRNIKRAHIAALGVINMTTIHTQFLVLSHHITLERCESLAKFSSSQ